MVRRSQDAAALQKYLIAETRQTPANDRDR